MWMLVNVSAVFSQIYVQLSSVQRLDAKVMDNILPYVSNEVVSARLKLKVNPAGITYGKAKGKCLPACRKTFSVLYYSFL